MKKSKTRIVLLLMLAAVTAFGVAQCKGSSGGGGGGGGGGFSWIGIARLIDTQLGEIAGVDCDGQATWDGNHCKNMLNGTVSVATVTQAVQIRNDLGVMFPGWGFGENGFAFGRGFAPGTADPCNEDQDNDGVPDVEEDNNWLGCTTAAQVTCTSLGGSNYRIEYDNCVLNITGDILDGIITYTLTPVGNESLMVATSLGYSEEIPGTMSFTISGTIATYRTLDIAGWPAWGTTGSWDGMEIISARVQIDRDDDGTDDSDYNMLVANDWEDGLVILNPGYQGVWWSDPINTTMNFYDADYPWNAGGDPSCTVTVGNETIDTFDITAATCDDVAAATGLSY